MNLEDKVRVVVHDLAGDARFPADLTAAARQQGRRIRRRRRVGVVAAALALVAATSIPYALLNRGGEKTLPQPAATTKAPIRLTPAPTDWAKAPLKLPGGAIVTAVSRVDVGSDTPVEHNLAQGNVVLDRKTGRYTPLTDDYYSVWGAPKVNRGVVDGDRSIGIIGADGDIVWSGVTLVRDPQWSPDGTRVLVTTTEGFAVVDAKTGEASRHSTFDAMYPCPDDCMFTWLPDGKRVAIGVRDLTAEKSETRPDLAVKVAIHDASTGERLRTVTVPGAPAGQDAWSPDGRRVVLKHTTAGGWGDRQIFDIDTQKVIAVIGEEDLHFLPNGQLLGLDQTDAYARLYDAHGEVLEEMSLPRSLAGRWLSIGAP